MAKEAKINPDTYSKFNQFDLDNIFLYRLDKNGAVPPKELWYDLKSVMEEMNVYEDISSGSISADLFMIDHFNIADKFPFVGGERLKITFKTTSYKDPETLDMVVYKVGKRIFSEDQAKYQGYMLHLCTPERYLDAAYDLSKAYRGTYADIVKSVVGELGGSKKVIADATLGIQTFIAPMWSPLKCAKWIASRSLDSDMSPFFFFETLDSYNMKSMKSLYTQNAYKTIYIEPRNSEQNLADPEKVFNTVTQWEYLESNDKLRQNAEGAFGTDIYIFDINNKTLDRSLFDYKDFFKQSGIHLENYPLFDDMATKRNKSILVHARNDMSHLGSVQKHALLNIMDNYKLMVNLPGDSTMRAGYVLDLEVPSLSGGTAYTPEQTTSGRWLIASLRHIFKRNKYSCVAELIKDSYARDITAIIRG